MSNAVPNGAPQVQINGAAQLATTPTTKAAIPAPPPPPTQPPFTPNLTYTFSASVGLGDLLGPIPIAGGVRVVQAITGGTISGPGFNATVEGGLAAPTIINNADGTVTQSPVIYAFGRASDGSPFYMEEKGLGSNRVQNTQLVVDVGGQYQSLRNAYILGETSVTADGKAALVQYFSIPLPPVETLPTVNA